MAATLAAAVCVAPFNRVRFCWPQACSSARGYPTEHMEMVTTESRRATRLSPSPTPPEHPP